MSSADGVHGNFIGAAMAWCAITPWCATAVGSAAISHGRWVVGAAATGVVGSYALEKTQDYFDRGDRRCPDRP